MSGCTGSCPSYSCLCILSPGRCFLVQCDEAQPLVTVAPVPRDVIIAPRATRALKRTVLLSSKLVPLPFHVLIASHCPRARTSSWWIKLAWWTSSSLRACTVGRDAPAGRAVPPPPAIVIGLRPLSSVEDEAPSALSHPLNELNAARAHRPRLHRKLLRRFLRAPSPPPSPLAALSRTLAGYTNSFLDQGKSSPEAVL